MSIDTFHAEAIVLAAFPFKEHDTIVTLFSKEKGLLKLFVKGTRTPSYLKNVLTSPLTVGEYAYSPGKGDLGRFIEGAVIEQHLELRSTFEVLQTAVRLVDVILRSQLPEKRAPALYELLLAFLKKLPEVGCHETFYTAFLLKVLKHEGILELPPKELGLTESDNTLFLSLVAVRSFQAMETYKVSSSLVYKVEALFARSI